MIDGEYLKRLRLEHGYTLDELAEKIHVSRSTINRWERQGTLADYDVIKQLAECYSVPVSQITGVEKETAATDEAVAADGGKIEAPSTPRKPISIFKTGLIAAAVTLILYMLAASITVLCIYFQPPIGDGQAHMWICTGEEIAVIISIIVLSEVVVTAVTVLTAFLIRKRRK